MKPVLKFLLVSVLVSTIWFLLGRPHSVLAPEIKETKLQCVSYAPFQKNESPYQLSKNLRIDPKRLESDLALLSEKFSCIRVYSVTGLEALPSLAKKYGLKLMMGAWVSRDPMDTQKELLQVIRLATQNREVVSAIIVGNEALLRQEVSGAQLAGYIREVKAFVGDIPVTYADVWEFWQKHPEVAPAVDFVTIHILPYWENDPQPIDRAIKHVEQIREAIVHDFPGKEIFIGEVGWPSEGRMREGALPSPINQARFIRGVVDLAQKKGWKYNLIEAFDQPWKKNNEGAVGGSWGLYDTNRKDKNVLSGSVSFFPAWPLLLFVSLLAAAVLTFAAPGSLRFIFLAVLASLAFALQFDQFRLEARSLMEVLEGAFLLGLSLFASLKLLSANPLRARSCLVIVFFMLWISLGLVFDSRYRSFPGFGFVLPTLLVMHYCLREPLSSPSAPFEPWVFLLLLSGFFIAWNETLLNFQADLWVLMCFLISGALIYRRGLSPFKSSFFAFLKIGPFLILGALIRYGLMEPVSWGQFCLKEPQTWGCQVRGSLGFLIYLQIFGRGALIALILYLIFKKRSWLLLSTGLGAIGLVLYNLNSASVAVILGYFFLCVSYNRWSKA